MTLKTFGRLLGASTLVAITLLLAQGADCAGIEDMVPVIEKVPKATGEEARKDVALGLDNDGNMMIRYRKTSLSLFCGPEVNAQEMKARSGSFPPFKDAVSKGEMIFKVSFAF